VSRGTKSLSTREQKVKRKGNRKKKKRGTRTIHASNGQGHGEVNHLFRKGTRLRRIDKEREKKKRGFEKRKVPAEGQGKGSEKEKRTKCTSGGGKSSRKRTVAEGKLVLLEYRKKKRKGSDPPCDQGDSIAGLKEEPLADEEGGNQWTEKYGCLGTLN